MVFIVSAPAVAFAAAITCLNESGPMSLRLVTVNVFALTSLELIIKARAIHATTITTDNTGHTSGSYRSTRGTSGNSRGGPSNLSVDRIIYSIFNTFNLKLENRPSANSQAA